MLDRTKQWKPTDEGPQDGEPSWRDCVINAEECRIRAGRDPERREQLLDEARYWDRLAERLR